MTPETTNIILTIIGAIYVPLWMYRQKQKKTLAENILSELKEIKESSIEMNATFGTKLDDHERRITKVEEKVFN